MDDVASLVKHANNPHIAGFMTDDFPHPYGEANGMAFINMVMPHNPVHIFAIEVEGEAAGGIGIHPQTGIMRSNAELGYWLGEAHWGKGIVSLAVADVVKYAFENFAITRIFARPFGTNMASKKVLEKNGFVLEAHIKNNILKNGEFLDELIYAVRK
jgi:[ribosomal protein S5]-alanine N-acetyltransferase